MRFATNKRIRRDPRPWTRRVNFRIREDNAGVTLGMELLDIEHVSDELTWDVFLRFGLGRLVLDPSGPILVETLEYVYRSISKI